MVEKDLEGVNFQALCNAIKKILGGNALYDGTCSTIVLDEKWELVTEMVNNHPKQKSKYF